MINEQNLDQLFEDSLGSMQAQPVNDLWSDISQQLDSISAAGMNVDKLFRESLSDYTQQPATNSWSKLNDKMNATVAKVDNSFYTSLSEFSTKPAAHVWQNIEAGLEACYLNNNRRYALWFSMAAGVVAVFWYMFMNIIPSYNQQRLQQSTKPQLIVINKNITETTSENSVTNIINMNLASSSESNAQVLNTSDEQLNNSSANGNSIIADINNNSIDNNSINNTSYRNNSTNQNINSEIKTISDNSDDLDITESGEMDNSIANDYSTEQNIAQKLVKIETLGLSSIIKKTNPVNEAQMQSSKKIFVSPTNIKSLHAATSFSIDIFAGPEFINLPMQKKTSSDENISLQTNKNTITDFTLGANINFHYNNFFLLSGLTYSSFAHNNNYLLKHEMHDTSGGYRTYKIDTWYKYDTLDWMVNPLNPNSLIPITSSTIHTDTLYSTWNKQDSTFYNYTRESSKNRYRYIEIPLMIGYRYSIKHFSISFAIGGSYGFKVAEQGKYIINNKIKDISELHTPYSNNIINGIASIGIEYSLTESIAVIIQPTFKTNLINFDSDFNSKATKYQNLSLRMGLNIKL